MRDDGDHPSDRGAARAQCVLAVAAGLLAALGAIVPAAAQTPRDRLSGYVQVQYESQDQRGGMAEDLAWWNRTAQLDYTRRLREALSVSAQGVWSDLSYVDRPDRIFQPRGSLRLAHRYFGANARYRPLRVTDARGVTVRQRETIFSGFLTRPGWPSVTGTWIRRHQLANDDGQASTGITRSTQANHQLGPLTVRASWGDQTRFVGEEEIQTYRQTNFGGGGTLAMTRGKTTGSLSYDFQGVERRAPGAVTERTGLHAVQGAAFRRLTSRVDVSANYTYRATLVRNRVRSDLEDHEGAILANLKATRVVRVTSGGGVRTANLESRQRTERYVLATVSAEGAIRRGMSGSAGVTRSYNWLPGETPHPVDVYRGSGRFRLARGLDLTADEQVTTSRSRAAIADTAGGATRVTAQSGFGLVAVPLRPIQVAYSWREYRTGARLFAPEARARATAWDLRWTPSGALSAYGTLSRARGLGARDPWVTTATANADWRPRASVQLTGTYTRSDQSRYDPTTGVSIGREIYGARLLMTIAVVWRLQASVNDADPGRPSHVRQWDLSLTRTLRR